MQSLMSTGKAIKLALACGSIQAMSGTSQCVAALSDAAY